MSIKTQKFAIIDVETTGGRANRDRVTEIGIVIHDGRQVLETFESLINPETYIPAGITQLTGITQAMVQDAPKFYEVARRIVELTEGTVFVAHNARFDYSFIKEEFARLGYTFSRKQLCTVRLSRKSFPGLPSYSLGKLIQHFGIKVDARHRALADALATAELFERILSQKNNDEDQFKEWLNMGIKTSRLPHNVKMEQIHDLPEACGVYYFYNAEGKVIYVGKSINIRKRIADHFADQTDKGVKLQQQVADISYEITGSELIALLFEAHEIKRLLPGINKAQRHTDFPYGIHCYTNEGGYLCFDVCMSTDEGKYDIISQYPSLSKAKGRLNAAQQQFALCSRLCNLFPGTGACFHFHLKQCLGACIQQESPEEYNARAGQAKARLSTVFDEDFLLLDQGRTHDEQAVVLVENGKLFGFGFIDKDDAANLQTIRDSIKPYPYYPETSRIIQHFMHEKPTVKVVRL